MDLNSDKFDREYDLLKEQLDRADALRKSYQGMNSNASNINIHAGGIGVWVCCTFCALCLMACIFTLWVVSEIKQNDRDQGNQLNAIYMMAPHLKPENKP